MLSFKNIIVQQCVFLSKIENLIINKVFHRSINLLKHQFRQIQPLKHVQLIILKTGNSYGVDAAHYTGKAHTIFKGHFEI